MFSWFLWRMEELRKAGEEGFTLIELLAVITFLFHKQLPRMHLRPN